MHLQQPPPVKFKSIALLLLAIWLGLTIYSGLSQISDWLTSHHHEFRFLRQLEFLTYRVWLPWVVMTPVVLWLARRFPVKPDNWFSGLALHMVFLLVLSINSALVISFHYHFFEEMAPGMETYQPWQHVGHFLFGDGVFLFHTIIYTVLVANLNIRNFAQRANDEALYASQLQSRLMAAQLQALKMQINPHFLFNTLNVISVLVMKSELDKANEMINRLSKFLRQTLDESDSHTIPLRKELNHIEQYLGIEQVRFGSRLKVEMAFDEPSLSVLVPSMLLQPLVENAMQHGLGEKEGQGVLRLSGQVQHHYLIIRIEDNGVGCAADLQHFKEGIGLSNVRARLTQLYETDFTFTLTPATPEGVIVTLRIPLSRSKHERP